MTPTFFPSLYEKLSAEHSNMRAENAYLRAQLDDLARRMVALEGARFDWCVSGGCVLLAGHVGPCAREVRR